MRLLALVVMLLGVAGVAFGVLALIGGMRGPGAVPFMLESYGGPGAVLGGLLLLFGGLYLKSVDVRD